MQNRNMFPFRRQGPKKRNKNNNPRNKMRGPQKALPNSARDMVATVQQATKSLAQMLAGRSRPSGQMAHAQSVLAHAERLIDDRQHNRLNPSEREEFFEQLARLRLTIADAESEALVVEEPEPKPQVAPVGQERLRAMALALSRPEPAPAPDAEVGEAAGDDRSRSLEDEADADAGKAAEAAAPATEPVALSAANARSGRLQLSRTGADEAADVLNEPLAPARPRRLRARVAPDPAPSPADPASSSSTASPEAESTNGAQPPAPGRRLVATGGNGGPAGASAAESGSAAENETGERRATTPRPRRTKTAKGLPEGWVIDEEGFVVPGPR